MGPGFKYHIVTISAIFFALTIGLVVGSVFVSPRFAGRQERAIKQLQDTLNNDIEQKREEISRYQEAMAAISPLALRGKLARGNVALIQTGDYLEAANRANDALSMADPRSIAHITILPAFDRPSDQLQTSLTALHAADSRFPADHDALIDQIASSLAHGDATNEPVLPMLERESFIRLTPDDSYALPIRYAVIVAGSRNPDSVRATRVDIPLIRALQKQGVTVVACEPRDAQYSDIPTLHAMKVAVSTVDNVDTDIGRCALILAFEAEQGDYGVKPGALHLLPTNGTMSP